jgi:hypothetical protein
MMTQAEAAAARGVARDETRLRMRYGLNEADSWWYFARGPHRARVQERLRELRPDIVRIFLYDKGTPDPIEEWGAFVDYVQAVINVGALPMITFAKFHRPFDDPRAIRWFAERCGDVAWGCLEQWGEAVRDWYWVVWNEPNSTWIGGGLSFEAYRRIYEAVAERVVRWLAPVLGGRRPPIGGPSIEGFDPFWMDWIWRFVNEIDPALYGLVNWHRYAEWREHGEKGAPVDAAAHHALIMAQAADYADRARDVARMLRGRGVLNVCGEWNAHSHYLPVVRARFNQSLFGATYGAAVLLQLMRSGVDAEMLWTGTDVDCGYGVIDGEGRPTPLFHAKKLCAQHVRPGDWVRFPSGDDGRADLDAVVARGDDGRQSALLVHLQPAKAAYTVAELDGRLAGCRRLLKVDAGTGGRVVESTCEGMVTFEGYGVALVTNAPPGRSEA